MVAYLLAGPDGTETDASRHGRRRRRPPHDVSHGGQDGPRYRRHRLDRQGAAVALAAMGARVGITGRDRARAEAAAAAIARESGNPTVDVFVADISSQAEVRRLARRGPRRVTQPGRARQQRRRLLGPPPPHRRRPGAHIRPQPPRAIPADEPAARAADRQRTGPRRHRLLRGAGDGRDRLRRSDGRALLLRAACLQRLQARHRLCSHTSWRDASRARTSPRTRSIRA